MGENGITCSGNGVSLQFQQLINVAMRRRSAFFFTYSYATMKADASVMWDLLEGPVIMKSLRKVANLAIACMVVTFILCDNSTLNLFIPVDDCRFSNGGCEQLCMMEEGSAVCSCRDGFLLGINGKSCVGKTLNPN